MKTFEERSLILDKDIFKHVNHGWRVVTRSDTKCMLKRDKRLKGSVFILLSLLFIIPGIVYLFIPKGTSTLLIEVNAEGSIHYNASGLSNSEKVELMWY